MIDLDVPGSPSSVRAAAEWLSPALRDAVTTWADTAADIRTSSHHWQGESGDAYRDTAARAVTAGDDQTGPLSDAAEKLRAYAGQLERMQEDFAEHLATAVAGGLQVNGTVVQPPADAVPPGREPGTGARASDVAAWETAETRYRTQVAKIELYEEIALAANAAWDDLESWIDANLTTLSDGYPSDSAAAQMFSALEKVSDFLTDGALGAYAGQVTDRIRALKQSAGAERDAAAATRHLLRSGDPARRALGEAAPSPASSRRAAAGLEAAADALGHSPLRHLPVIGTAVGLGTTAYDLASGESPSGVLVGELGAVAGGALGGALVAGGVAVVIGATAPVSLVAIGAAAGAVLVGEGATWAYENWVPQDVREAIDAGIEDAWDATTDFAEGAWSAITDGVSSGWRGAFG